MLPVLLLSLSRKLTCHAFFTHGLCVPELQARLGWRLALPEIRLDGESLFLPSVFVFPFAARR
jgi:hypothetical protein